jgi:hypothetical protein
MNVIYRLDDISVMGHILVRLGYSLIVPLDAGSISRGRIAAKDDMEVNYNPDRQLISISGRNPDRVLKAFTESNTTELNPYLYEDIYFYLKAS